VNDDRLRALRREYGAAPLEIDDVDPDPIVQFGTWMADAVTAGIEEPNAMVLSTADRRGRPSGRAVLLKGLDSRGFVFYTNYGSRKVDDLDVNPRAALCFVWLPLHRQVRIEGDAERVSAAESDAYFASRPRDARLGAHASPQSRPIPDREWLDRRFAEVEAGFRDTEPPRPPDWGGYRVRPVTVEFWQGRLNRLHDRIRYRGEGDGWSIDRLAP
jgi:pyridoxamine 5'-phosphate oxidase